MSNKIFISYKYWDDSVYQDQTLNSITSPYLLSGLFINNNKITPRSYLNALEKMLEGYAIQKWEDDNIDLSNFKDSTIKSKLRDKIYDSSITIVLVSPGMKNPSKSESEQWIPWEISYSLKNIVRNGRTSLTSGIIAVVLPDAYNLYDYCLSKNNNCGAIRLNFNSQLGFEILGDNFFNKKNPNKQFCSTCGNYHFLDGEDAHYCAYAKWNDFIGNPDYYIDLAIKHSQTLGNYDLHKEV